MGIAACGVGTWEFDETACVDGSVGIDDIVVADVGPAEGTMVAADGFYCAGLPGTGGSAMDDDFGDCTHNHFVKGRTAEVFRNALPVIELV